MPAEAWVYGGALIGGGLVVWRLAMQYYAYLEDTYNAGDVMRDQLRIYLGMRPAQKPIVGSPAAGTATAASKGATPPASGSEETPDPKQ